MSTANLTHAGYFMNIMLFPTKRLVLERSCKIFRSCKLLLSIKLTMGKIKLPHIVYQFIQILHKLKLVIIVVDGPVEFMSKCDCKCVS